MSKLAELLEARKLTSTPANLAKPAKLEPGFHNFRNFRKGPSENSALTPNLQRRIEAMAQRWSYTPAETQGVLERASTNPLGWSSAVACDEEREMEFRSLGLLAVVSA
jgi:hypothetical protein